MQCAALTHSGDRCPKVQGVRREHPNDLYATCRQHQGAREFHFSAQRYYWQQQEN